MREANRSYEANLQAIKQAREMISMTIDHAEVLMIDPILPSAAAATTGPRSVAGADFASTRGVTPAADAETGADFGAMLTQMASDAASVVRNAEATSVAGIQGRASVQQVVEAVMSAEQTLQGAIAIRDKVVAAYLEISRMPI